MRSLMISIMIMLAGTTLIVRDNLNLRDQLDLEKTRLMVWPLPLSKDDVDPTVLNMMRNWELDDRKNVRCKITEFKVESEYLIICRDCSSFDSDLDCLDEGGLFLKVRSDDGDET